MEEAFFKHNEDPQLDLTIYTSNISTCSPCLPALAPHPKVQVPHIPSQPPKLLFSYHVSCSLADLRERPRTGRRPPSWMPEARGCFLLSLHFSAPLETQPLPFLCANLTSEKIPVHLAMLFLSGRAQLGPVLCCGAAAAHQPFEPSQRSHLVPAAQELPASQGYNPDGWGHKFIRLKFPLHHITGQGSKRQGLFIIFLKWKPEEVTHYYWRLFKPPRKKSDI